MLPIRGLRVKRRLLLATLTGCLIGSTIARAASSAGHGRTGIPALDDAAITVTRPARVFLISICRAGNRLVAVGEHGVAVYSDDEGSSWIQARVPVDVTLTSVMFATPLVGWCVGHFGVILRTDDGGVNWQIQVNGIIANQLTLAAAQEADATHSQALGAPFALRRANVFLKQGPSNPFLSILALSTQKALAFGAYRMMMMTTDGGKSWTDRSLSIGDALSHNLYGSAVIGPDIFVVGEGGIVFKSTDGGESFPAVTAPTDSTLFGVIGLGFGDLIAYGVAGRCFHSTGTASNWTLVDLGTSSNLTSAIRLSSGRLLMATEAGSIYPFENGVPGKALRGIPVITVANMTEANNGDLVLVGRSGVLSVSPSILTQ